MSTTGINLDELDPNLLSQAQQLGFSGEQVSTTGSTLLNAETTNTEGQTNEVTDTSDVIDSSVITKDNDSITSLLSQSSDEDSSSTSSSVDNITDTTDSNLIDVESVKPDFVLDDTWQSTGFGADNSTWQENDDGTWTQTLSINFDYLGEGNETNISYNWDKDGKYIGLSDGSEVAKTSTVQNTENLIETEELLGRDNIGETIELDDGVTAQGVDTTGDGEIDSYTVTDADGNETSLTSDEYSTTYGYDSKTTINTEPITLDSGNFAYGFDSDGDGEIDTYRITDASGTEIETIDADQYTGTGYVAGSTEQTITVGADDASTDATYIGLVNSIKTGLENDEDYATGVWLTGSTDEDGDGIPDGILATGLSADSINEHTFADGSKGFIFTIEIPDSEITTATKTSLYFNENGQLVGQDGKGYEGMELVTNVKKTDSDDDDDSDDGGDSGLDTETLDAIRTTLTEILVDTGSDVTDDFATLYNEISGLFATGDDGVLTADDEQQLLAFFNTMITQGTDTGVILSSKTMTDYFNLVKEYTGQYNGVISEADLDTFLDDWLSESVLFVSGLDNSQKWSLDNITDHGQYENLQNLIELIYGEGRVLTAEEAMRYLTDYSWKSEGKGWLYGVGGDSIADIELSVTNFLVSQMVLNAEGADQEYVLSFWLSNDDIDLSSYGLTVEAIAEAWGISTEELRINTAKAKKDKDSKKSTGSFFAPKDVVRIGDEDPGSSPQTITGKRGRSKTKPTTLLGGSIKTSTLTGSN